MVKGRLNARLKPFTRDVLFLTIYESCKHRGSAVTDATNLTQTVMNALLASHPGAIIDTTTIAYTAHQVLSAFDDVAATLYAAYHTAALSTS